MMITYVLGYWTCDNYAKPELTEPSKKNLFINLAFRVD